MTTDLCKRNASQKKWLLVALMNNYSVPPANSQVLLSQTLTGSLDDGYGPSHPAINSEDQKNIVYEETQTGNSSKTAAVAATFNFCGVRSNLYLAAISTRLNVPVAFVMGLGLAWTRVTVQNSARTQASLELWMARGTPTSSGTVTAFLDDIAEHAVIAVSRYSGVNPRNPIGAVIAGNPLGVSGNVDLAVIGVEIKPDVSETAFVSGFEDVSIDPADGIYPSFMRMGLKALPAAGN